LLSLSIYGIKLHWDEGFENFLIEHKKRRKVMDPGTVAYYRNLFKKHLEGEGALRIANRLRG